MHSKFTYKQTQWLAHPAKKEEGPLPNSDANPVGHLMLALILKVS